MKYSFLLFLLLSQVCQAHTHVTQLVSRTQVIMGTFCTLTLDEKYDNELNKGFMHLKGIEHVLSSYQADALLSQLNTKRSVPTNTLLKDIIEKSIHYYTQTQGYFDITIGSITKKLYHFGEKERVPTEKEIFNVVLGTNKIIIENKNIILKDDIVLDLGGIGKGYGVDSLSAYYAHKGINKGQIALSGDIRCLDACKVSIQSPFKEEETLGTLHAKVKNLSVSTSGTYRRYVKEKKYHHLINPKTKTQGRAFVSVTIVAQKNNTLCDVMATAIATMPKGIALKFVHSQKIFGYILVTAEGKIISGNLEKFVDFNHSP